MSLQKPLALYQIGNEIENGSPNIRIFVILLPQGVHRTEYETKTGGDGGVSQILL